MSDCTNCSGGSPKFYTPVNVPCTFNTPASSSSKGCCPLESSCIIYTSFPLENLQVEPGDNLEVILQNLNNIIGGLEGIDWSSFNYHCLDDEDISTAGEFASAVTENLCDLRATFTSFVSTTYASKIQELENAINGIEEPSLSSCSGLGVTTSDSLSVLLTKVMGSICGILDAINPSGADWRQSHVVPVLPDTITTGFDLIIDWIEDLQVLINTGSITLPLFDNRNSCIGITGITDTLYQTVVAIRDTLCQKPTFDTLNISWSPCIVNPSPSGGPQLEQTISSLIGYLQATYSLRVVQFDPVYFDTTDFVPGSPCSGKMVTLSGFVDSKVALDSGDANPGFLLDKLEPGAGLAFDTVSSPGKAIIDFTDDIYKVKTVVGDPNPDYLTAKIKGQPDVTGAITLQESQNNSTNQTDLTPVIDYTKLATEILYTVNTVSSVTSIFNGLVCSVECLTTTTTTAAPIIPQTSVKITAEGVLDPEYSIVYKQNSPTLDWYIASNSVLPIGTSTNTGFYDLTTTDVPPSAYLSIVNENAMYSMSVIINVVDENNMAVPNSSDYHDNVAANTALTLSNFILGDPRQQYKLEITLGLIT